MSRFYSRPGLLAVWMFRVPKDSGPVCGWGAADCHSLVGGGGRPGHKCRFFAGLMLGSVRGREGGSATHPRGCDSFCFEYTVGVVSEPPINEILGEVQRTGKRPIGNRGESVGGLGKVWDRRAEYVEGANVQREA